MFDQIKFTTFQVLVGLDQIVNALLGGYVDETLSSRSYRMHAEGKPWGFLMHVINAIFWFQPDHCKKAYDSERLRAQEPPELRA